MVAASGCAPPMPPRPAGQDPAARQAAAVVLAADLAEGLVGALDDALAADVDPGPGSHLAVHHQALAIQLVKPLPRCPVRHQVAVGQQHAGGRRCGCGRCRRACRTGSAGSRRHPGGAGRRRCGHKRPSCGRRGRCHRRRPDPAGARPRRGPGCSSASAGPPPAASRGRSAPGRAGRGWCAGSVGPGRRSYGGCEAGAPAARPTNVRRRATRPFTARPRAQRRPAVRHRQAEAVRACVPPHVNTAHVPVVGHLRSGIAQSTMGLPSWTGSRMRSRVMASSPTVCRLPSRGQSKPRLRPWF